MAKKTLEDLFKERSNYVLPEEIATVEEVVAPRENYVERAEKLRSLSKQIHQNDLKAAEANAALTEIKQVAPNKTVVISGPLEVGGIVEEKPKVQAPVAPKAPAVEAPLEDEPILVEEVPTAASKTQALREELKQKEGTDYSLENPWMRALVGATPLLVGLLTGNKLEGVQTSADYFTKTEGDLWKRELDLNDKLRELASKERSGGGSNRFVPTTIALEDGTPVKVTFDKQTGKYLNAQGREITDETIRAGYAVSPEEFNRRKDVSSFYKRADADYLGQGVKVNPVDGELGYARDGKWNKIQGIESGTLNVKQQEERNKLSNEFRQNPVVKAVLPVARTAQSIQNLLRSGKPVSQAAAKTLLARMSGEVGNLSEMEQRVYEGSPSIVEKVSRWMSLQATDRPLQPHEVQDLIDIANYYAKASVEILDRAAEETVRVGVEDFNLPADSVYRAIAPIYAPMKDQFNKGAEKAKTPSVVFNGKRWESDQPEKTIPFQVVGVKGMEGQVFWASEDEWKDIERNDPQARRIKK